MTGYSAEVVADSVSPDGVRLTSILTRYPLGVHQDVLRHRTISHSVSSLRAMKPEDLIEQVREDPFVPDPFNGRVKGMGVGDPLDEPSQIIGRNIWWCAAEDACVRAEGMLELGVDKSRINWVLAPYLWVTDLMTATEWSNFFALRDHPDARPEVQTIARMMREAMEESEPFKLDYGEWHMPLLTTDEYPEALAECGATHYWDEWKSISAGRCARVSYDKQYEEEDHERSLARTKILIKSGHLSPMEHVARPMWGDDWDDPDLNRKIVTSLSLDEDQLGQNSYFCGNLRGWVSMRKEIPDEDDFSKIIARQEMTT